MRGNRVEWWLLNRRRWAPCSVAWAGTSPGSWTASV